MAQYWETDLSVLGQRHVVYPGRCINKHTYVRASSLTLTPTTHILDLTRAAMGQGLLLQGRIHSCQKVQRTWPSFSSFCLKLGKEYFQICSHQELLQRLHSIELRWHGNALDLLGQCDQQFAPEITMHLICQYVTGLPTEQLESGSQDLGLHPYSL